MRFQNSRRTPYLNRRDQLRLMAMVGLIGFVVIAIEFAGRPSTWFWLTGVPGAEADRESVPESASEVDFQPKVDGDRLPADVVRVANDFVPEDADRFRGGGKPQDDHVAVDVTVAPELIAQIQNNRVGLRDAERGAYYYMLARTRDLPLKTLQQASRRDLSFTLLMNESDRFIGQLITLKGEVRRLQRVPSGTNDYGVEAVWEAWIFNRDSGLNPYCVRTTSIPDGIPTGTDFKSGTIVEVTGYFFRRYGYPAQEDRLHVAPMVLAAQPRWLKPLSARKRDDPGLVPIVLAFAVVMGTAIAATLWRFRVSDRKFEKRHLRMLTDAPESSIAAIEGLPTIDVEESLRMFAESQSMGIQAAEPTDLQSTDAKLDDE